MSDSVIKVDGNGNIVAAGSINLQIEKVASLLSKIAPKLMEIALKAESINTAPRANFEIELKISHNDLKTYKPWVERYGEYGHTIDGIYDSLDNDFASSKARIMLSIATYYTSEKVILLAEYKGQNNSMDIIRENSDLLFDRVVQRIKTEISSGKVDPTITVEDLIVCSTVIASHGFIHCKILEKPPVKKAIT